MSSFIPKAGCALCSPVVFQHQTQCLGRGGNLLLVDWWNARSALLPSHSPWLAITIFFSQIIQAPPNPVLVFLSLSSCALSSYSSYCPHQMTSRGGTMPWVPSTMSLSASQLLFFLKEWPSSWKPYCSKLHLLSCIFVRAQYSHLIEHSLGEVLLFLQLRTLFSDLLI